MEKLATIALLGVRRHQVRSVLLIAALCASRRNPILRDFYSRLITHGKHQKFALVAVMRKLVMILNHMIKNPNFLLSN